VWGFDWPKFHCVGYSEFLYPGEIEARVVLPHIDTTGNVMYFKGGDMARRSKNAPAIWKVTCPSFFILFEDQGFDRRAID